MYNEKYYRISNDKLTNEIDEFLANCINDAKNHGYRSRRDIVGFCKTNFGLLESRTGNFIDRECGKHSKKTGVRNDYERNF